ncbi:UNVERIFIED_CONTAM: hypothetical protein FKN15_074458 [Acipenser sinensis]
MDTNNFDCIVLGAGIQGSYTAYHLAKNKKKTLLVEQFVLPHSRGSSHGHTRIIRKAYEQDYYTRMMSECYQLWAQLEKEANVQIYRNTGMLVVGKEDCSSFRSLRGTLLRNNVPMEVLSPEQFASRFPSVRLPPGESAVIDKTAGVLHADRALKAVQDLFRGLGGVIHDGEKVVDFTPGSPITMTTNSGMYRTQSLVITAGPWAKSVLARTGLQLPLQICYHSGSETEPDERDRQTSQEDIAILSSFVSKSFPGLDPTPAVVEQCMYTVTPDSDFILDQHPSHSNIIIGAGFSGHGFKLAPVVGKILCELALGKTPSFDLSPFRITRFQSLLKSAL